MTKMRLRILITTIALVLASVTYVYLNTRQNDPMEIVVLIKKNINPKDGSIMDYAGDINFRGFDSIGYIPIDDTRVRIFFGDLQFEMKKEDFENEQLMENLKAIGFEIVRSKKTGKIVVKYKGEPVKLYKE